MENKEALNTLTEIRNLMEKSTKFSSLSGLAVVLVGIYACIGTWIAQLILSDSSTTTIFNIPILNINTPYRLMLISTLALIILLVCLVTLFVMCYMKNKKANNKNLFAERTTWRLTWNFFVPLVTGGIFCFSLLYHQHYGLTSSIMLIFYGLALVNASKYTYSDIQYLGYAELILGLIDSFVVNYALVFWVAGFGLFHIIFGIYFFLKFERKQQAQTQNRYI